MFLDLKTKKFNIHKIYILIKLFLYFNFVKTISYSSLLLKFLVHILNYAMLLKHKPMFYHDFMILPLSQMLLFNKQFCLCQIMLL